MGNFIALRRRIVNLVAAGAAITEMPETGNLEMGGNDVFLKVLPRTDAVFITERMAAIGAMIQRLLDDFIDLNGLFPSAAGFAGFLAQLFLMLFIALGRLDYGFVAART